MSSPPIANNARQVNDWKLELHTDHLKRGVDDMDVVALCGRHGWALVTCDEMRYTPETKAAIVTWNVAVFKVVIHKKTNGIEIAAAMIAGRRRMLDLLAKQKPPFCAHVQLNGSVNLMSDFEDIALTESQRRTLRKYQTATNLIIQGSKQAVS
jgi:hypothetical protein